VPVPAGEVAVIEVGEFTVTPVAKFAPNLTDDSGVKFVPLIVTDVPPAPGPLVGSTLVTLGGSAYVNWSAGVMGLVPPCVRTVTSTVPVPAGAVASRTSPNGDSKAPPPGKGLVPKKICSTQKPCSASPGRAVALKPLPSIVTLVPPAGRPLPGRTEVTTGS